MQERHLYRTLAADEWRRHLCGELCEVMDVIRACEDNPVAALGYDNIKAPEFVAILARPLTSETLRQVEAACARHAGLRFTPGGVGCGVHFSEIDWERPAPRPQGWFRRLVRWMGR